MRFNWPIILSFQGLLLMISGFCMVICTAFSFYYNESSWKALLISGSFSMIAGAILRLLTLNNENKNIKKRDGYLIVTLGWLTMSLAGSIPFVISGAIPDFTNAFFETMSGFTTTGATILTDIEALPHGILFWRSFTHWIGGMGIIVLTVAILPLLGIGGMQLFRAESPGVTPDKLHPRITETAKRLWFIYVALTAAEMILLILAGLSFFDAINHAMATMATGGFSTKNASIAAFDSPLVHYIIIVFMFLAGTNFTLMYLGFKGNLKQVWRNEEFRFYTMSLFFFSVVVVLTIYFFTGIDMEQAIRTGVFQVVAIITTTGFVTSDYTNWTPFLTILFFILFFTGASAGSTSGGIKMMRHLILIKNSILELKRQLHPSAIIPVRFNGRAVSQNITFNIMAFILIYFFIFFAGSLIMAMILPEDDIPGREFITAISTVTATLGNIGPGLGGVGPIQNFSEIPHMGKWFLSFLMLLGRLELFTVLILLTPFFWKRY